MTTPVHPVLYQYKTTFTLWLMPLFFVIGCLLLAMAIGLPLLLRPPAEPGLWVSVGVAALAGLGLPLLGVLLWLLIPAITTTYDLGQRVLALEYRRPLSRSVQTYPVDEIADIVPVSSGDNTYSLTMVLKSGKHVRLEHSATSDTRQLKAAAARIKAVIGLGAGVGPREVRL